MYACLCVNDMVRNTTITTCDECTLNIHWGIGSTLCGKPSYESWATMYNFVLSTISKQILYFLEQSYRLFSDTYFSLEYYLAMCCPAYLPFSVLSVSTDSLIASVPLHEGWNCPKMVEVKGDFFYQISLCLLCPYKGWSSDLFQQQPLAWLVPDPLGWGVFSDRMETSSGWHSLLQGWRKGSRDCCLFAA